MQGLFWLIIAEKNFAPKDVAMIEKVLNSLILIILILLTEVKKISETDLIVKFLSSKIIILLIAGIARNVFVF